MKRWFKFNFFSQQRSVLRLTKFKKKLNQLNKSSYFGAASIKMKNQIRIQLKCHVSATLCCTWFQRFPGFFASVDRKQFFILYILWFLLLLLLLLLYLWEGYNALIVDAGPEYSSTRAHTQAEGLQQLQHNQILFLHQSPHPGQGLAAAATESNIIPPPEPTPRPRACSSCNNKQITL